MRDDWKSRLKGGVGLPVSRCIRWILTVLACLAWSGVVCAQQPPAADDGPKFEIKRFVFEGATLISKEAFDAATAGFAGPGRSFADVQRALEAVEKLYSSNGWSAVQVLLPEQELERGDVRFQIIEARIGRVLIEGNKFFDEANIRASVPSLKPGSAPNIDAIARNLRVANESGAKQTTVLLRSGQQEATVDAVVRVVDEGPYKSSITVDSSGTAQTGKLRVGLGFQNSNVNNSDHVLTLQYVGAPYQSVGDNEEPTSLSLVPNKRVFVLGAGYRIPLYESGDSVDFSAGYSTVNSGTVGSLFSISGAGGLFGARYNRNLDRIGDYEHRLIFSFDFRGYQNQGVRAAGTTNQLVRDVTVHPLSVQYTGQFRGQDSETGFSAGASQNFAGGADGTGSDWCAPLPGGALQARSSGAEFCATPRYRIYRWGANHNRVMGGDWQLRYAMNGQFTRYMLVPGEQFGIGGADSVRGFLEREIANDNGYRGVIELYGPDWGGKTGISGARARGLLFVDWGGVWRNRPGPGEAHAQHVGSYGFGMRFSRGANLSFRADYATVWDPGGNQGSGDGRLHFSASYIF
jgi:hemolysin activation/secretion protein